MSETYRATIMSTEYPGGIAFEMEGESAEVFAEAHQRGLDEFAGGFRVTVRRVGPCPDCGCEGSPYHPGDDCPCFGGQSCQH